MFDIWLELILYAHVLNFDHSISCIGVLIGSLYIARTSSSLEDAVEANILAGGDSCSRGILVGALFGAYSPLTGDDDAIPAKWVESVNPGQWSLINTLSYEVSLFLLKF